MIYTMAVANLDGHYIEDIKIEDSDPSLLWKGASIRDEKFFTGRDKSTGEIVRFPPGKVTTKQWEDGTINVGDTVRVAFKVSSKGYPYAYFVLIKSKKQIEEESRESERIRKLEEEERRRKKEEAERKLRDQREGKQKYPNLNRRMQDITRKLRESHPDVIGSSPEHEKKYRELIDEYKKIKARLREVM
jgi:hypothetical protein